MARYWVGGSGTWNTSSTTNWSSSSGGGSGASVPTASDDVIFDSATTYTVTVSGSVSCLSFTVSDGLVAFTGASQQINISGSMTLASGKVSSWHNDLAAYFISTSGSKTITTNNFSIGATTFDGVGGTWVLGSAFSVNNGAIDLNNGTLSTSSSNFSVTAAIFRASGTTARTLNLNASTFTLTSTTWNCSTSTNLTVLGSGATVSMNESVLTKTFAGGGANWGAITLNQGGATQLTISGSNTFANISNSYNATGATTIAFTSGTTQTVSSFTAAGSSGNILTINSTTPGTAATLSKASGTVSVSFLSIQDSTATGGATWNALNSTNVSGNTGWVITAPISNANFFLVM